MSQSSWGIAAPEDEPDVYDQPLLPDIRVSCGNVWVISAAVKSRIDVVLIKEDVIRWVGYTQVPDVSPVAHLGRGVECRWALLGVVFVHAVIEGARVRGVVNVSRGIDHDTAFALALDETYRREKETVYVPTDPPGENQEEAVIATVDDLLHDRLRRLMGAGVVVA